MDELPVNQKPLKREYMAWKMGPKEILRFKVRKTEKQREQCEV